MEATESMSIFSVIFLVFIISSWLETVTEWVAELETWFDCQEDFSSIEACTDYIRVTMTSILGELEQWKRGSLAAEWCLHWGSCTNDELAEFNPVEPDELTEA